MKRGQDNLYTDRANKMSKYFTDALSDLPDDEFKLVLRYLDHESKGNLKLTSKSNEKRVMSLDPNMRSWHIQFDNMNWESLGMSLSLARIRHAKAGNLQDIKLAVNFARFYDGLMKHLKSESDSLYSFLIMTDNVINHWKNNIVNLAIAISGFESFLLDSDLKMPQLNILQLEASEDRVPKECNDDLKVGIHSIVSALIENHQDTIEVLKLEGLNLGVPKNQKLNLIKFHAKDIPIESVASVLKSSQPTLKILIWEYSEAEIGELDFGHVDFFDSELESIDLHLNRFEAYRIHDCSVKRVLESAYQTLKYFNYTSLEGMNDFHFDKPLPVLETFTAKSLTIEKLIQVLRSSQQSLKEIDLSSSLPSHCVKVLPSEIKLNLNKFCAQRISKRMISSVLKSSHESLKVLTLLDVSESFVRLQLDSLQLPLESFDGENIDMTTVDDIIQSSQATLAILELTNVIPTLEFILLPTELNLRELVAENVPGDTVISTIKASEGTLENIKLTSIILPSVATLSSNFDPKKSKIKTLFFL